MKIYRNNNLKNNHCKGVLAIGNFDGIHLGHHKVIKDAKHQAKKNKLPFNCHYFTVQDNEFSQWIKKKITFEEVLGTRRFTYERYPNNYNVKINSIYTNFL